MLMLLNKCQIRVIGLLNYNSNVIKLGLVIKWTISQALGEDKFINEVIPLGEGKLDMHASPIIPVSLPVVIGGNGDRLCKNEKSCHICIKIAKGSL